MSSVSLWKWICSSRGISRLSNGTTSVHDWLSTAGPLPCVLVIDTRATDRQPERFLRFGTRVRRLRTRKGTTGWATSPSAPRFSVRRRCLLRPGRPGTRNLVLNTIQTRWWSEVMHRLSYSYTEWAKNHFLSESLIWRLMKLVFFLLNSVGRNFWPSLYYSRWFWFDERYILHCKCQVLKSNCQYFIWLLNLVEK